MVFSLLVLRMQKIEIVTNSANSAPIMMMAMVSPEDMLLIKAAHKHPVHIPHQKVSSTPLVISPQPLHRIQHSGCSRNKDDHLRYHLSTATSPFHCRNLSKKAFWRYVSRILMPILPSFGMYDLLSISLLRFQPIQPYPSQCNPTRNKNLALGVPSRYSGGNHHQNENHSFNPQPQYVRRILGNSQEHR